MIALVCLAGLFSLVNLSGVAAAEHKPQPLDKADMMKKKNMAMKNMDKYMAGGMKEMMMKFPKAATEK